MRGAAPHAATFVEVAPFAPLRSTLTYRVPADLELSVKNGVRVLVPLGARKVVGVIVGVDVEPGSLEPKHIKPILDLLDEDVVLEKELLEFLLWTAAYYLVAPGEVLRAALPNCLGGQQEQILHLTEAGEHALKAHGELLRRAEQDLNENELEILVELEKRGGTIQRRRDHLKGPTLATLLVRGFVSNEVRRVQPTKPKSDLLIKVIEPMDWEGVSRAPAQRRFLELVQNAGGQAYLGSLIEVPRDARSLAKKLAFKGFLEVEEVEIPRDPFAAEPIQPDPKHELKDEQKAALDPMLDAVQQGEYKGFLLHGITGSGKTEIYLRLIADVIQKDRTALVLVPEISLTPQLAARFRARFGDQIAVLHSGLSDGERYDQWRRIRAGQVQIVVGARSAIFAPLRKLGVVIVDEEHDSSFKQEEGVRYNARDLALVRAKRTKAIAVLGSATPSLESYYGANQGR
ncbi:MAG: primosomal protein N', partial [Pseudomonadota bacterium]